MSHTDTHCAAQGRTTYRLKDVPHESILTPHTRIHTLASLPSNTQLPTHEPLQLVTSVRRDLVIEGKRPTIEAKETYYRGKTDLQ